MKKKWSIIVKRNYFADLNDPATDENCIVPTKNEICISELSIEDAYDHLFVEWIGVDELFTAITKIYTQATLFNGQCVVTEVLRSGLKAYSMTLDDKKGYLPNERLKFFITGCLNKARAIGDIKVIDGDSYESWTVLNEIPLYEWGFNRKKLIVEDNKSKPEDFAVGLYEIIIPKNFKHAMRRFQHETAIMVGTLGHCA